MLCQLSTASEDVFNRHVYNLEDKFWYKFAPVILEALLHQLSTDLEDTL